MPRVGAHRRSDSLGSYDLYVSFVGEDGSRSEPVDLGEAVNATGDEDVDLLRLDGCRAPRPTGRRRVLPARHP